MGSRSSRRTSLRMGEVTGYPHSIMHEVWLFRLGVVLDHVARFLDHLDGVVAKQHRETAAIDVNEAGLRRRARRVLRRADGQGRVLPLPVVLPAPLRVRHVRTGLRAVVVACSLALFAGVHDRLRPLRRLLPGQVRAAVGSKSPALRAVSEGKLKQKFESVGLALYALTLPDPALPEVRTRALVNLPALRGSPPGEPPAAAARGRARSDPTCAHAICGHAGNAFTP